MCLVKLQLFNVCYKSSIADDFEDKVVVDKVHVFFVDVNYVFIVNDDFIITL